MKKVFIKVIVVFLIITVGIMTFLDEERIANLKAHKGILNLNQWNLVLKHR